MRALRLLGTGLFASGLFGAGLFGTGLLWAGPAGSAEPSGAAGAVARGAAFLAGRQGADGSVPAGWRPDQVAEALTALVAGGQNTAAERAIGFLARTGAGGASSGPYAGRIVAGLVAAGENPRAFAGEDFVARLESFSNPVTGGYGGSNVYADALAMAGVLAAGDALPAQAVTKLRVDQCRDGGWSQRSGCLDPPDTDTTALVTAVLAAATDPAAADVQAGRRWLLGAQRASGCWGLRPADAVNANSCALAVAAATGLREDVRVAPWSAGDREVTRDLTRLQLASGAFAYQRGGRADDYATVQAVTALAGFTVPVRPAPQRGAAPGGPVPAGASSAGARTTGSPQSSRSDRPSPDTSAAPPPSPSDRGRSANPSAREPSPHRARRVVRSRPAGRGGSGLVGGALAGLLAGVAAAGVLWRRRPRPRPRSHP